MLECARNVLQQDVAWAMALSILLVGQLFGFLPRVARLYVILQRIHTQESRLTRFVEPAMATEAGILMGLISRNSANSVIRCDTLFEWSRSSKIPDIIELID